VPVADVLMLGAVTVAIKTSDVIIGDRDAAEARE